MPDPRPPELPTGTAYAVWVGIGATLTVTFAMATGAESVSAGKIVFIAGIVGAVVGLKLVPHASAADRSEERERS